MVITKIRKPNLKNIIFFDVQLETALQCYNCKDK